MFKHGGGSDRPREPQHLQGRRQRGAGLRRFDHTAKEILLAKKSFWGALEGQFLSNELADLLNLPPNATGYLIKTVAKDSPADHAGLRGGTTFATIGGEQVVLGGDILLTIEGIQAGSVANVTKIRDKLSGLKSGATLKATVLRAGRVLELTGRVPLVSV